MKHMCWKALITAWLLCLAAPSEASAGVRFVLAPAEGPLVPGSPQIVSIYVLNESDTRETVVVPGTIRAAMMFGEQSTEIDLIADQASQEVVIEPRSFAVIRCRLAVPEDASANSILVLSPATVDTLATTKPKVASEPSAPLVEVPSSSQTVAEAGLVEYRPLQFSAHEPIYFLVGAEEPNGKFQFSFKYQVVPTSSPLGRSASWTTGFHLGYTQVSFWDLEGESKPFIDSSYKPELMWLWDNIRPGSFGPVSRFDLQLGLQHESNGRDGDDSRSLNIAYIRPVVTFGERDKWFMSVGPRLWTYVGSLDDNDDIEEFRGYGDLKVVVGKGDGIQLAAIGRIGSDWDKGSLQLDLSYPIRRVLFDSIDVYLHGQLFTGYGESLLGYDDSDTNFRVGISLVR